METIRRQLAEKIVGKELDKKKVAAVRRRAKILIIDFNDGSSLLFHLKLTGQLVFNGQPGKYTRKVFDFGDGSRLIFNDARKFGWWKFVENTQKIEKALGPEALEIRLGAFSANLKQHTNARIKPLLMDQKFIAGIGNIYSDEILFAAKVYAMRRVRTLTDREIGLIHASIKKILKNAIKHKGSSVQYYLDACGNRGGYVKYHRVYQKEGEKCSRKDGGVIKRIKLGGRSVHFCPKCQE